MNLTKLEAIPAVQAVGIRLLHAHQFVYERSGGRIGHRLGRTRNLLLHTVGAKSGQPRTNALTYARDGRSYVVVASMGGAPKSPGWYHNLQAEPDVEIQVGTRRLPVQASFVVPGDPDRDRLWDLVNRSNGNRYANYQTLTKRPIPIAVLSPR